MKQLLAFSFRAPYSTFLFRRHRSKLSSIYNIAGVAQRLQFLFDLLNHIQKDVLAYLLIDCLFKLFDGQDDLLSTIELIQVELFGV